MSKKIFLSPSNQTDNNYAYGNTTEAEQCGRIAEACKAALLRCGFEVKISHLDGMAEKCRQSNAWPADLHVPIHTNAANGNVSGTRMFYYAEGTNSYKACKAIYDVLAPITPGTSENMRAYPSLYEMRNTDATSVYVEVDFHDVADVAKWIISHTTEIGEAICKGICNYYGVTYQAAGGSTQPAGKSYTPGWHKNSKGWWYADSADSYYKSQWAVIKGQSYYFDAQGYMAANCVVGLNADGQLQPLEPYYHLLGDVPEDYRGELDKLVAAGVLRGREGTGDNMVLDLPESAVRAIIICKR